MEAPALRFDIPKSQSDVEKNGFSIWGIYGNIGEHMVKYGEYMGNMRENMGNMWENMKYVRKYGKI